jgi:hypothetical protein
LNKKKASLTLLETQTPSIPSMKMAVQTDIKKVAKVTHKLVASRSAKNLKSLFKDKNLEHPKTLRRQKTIPKRKENFCMKELIHICKPKAQEPKVP